MRVGICVERSPEMVVGIVGVLKAGGVYVPLDGEYPQARLGYMVEDAGVELVLTDEEQVEKVAGILEKSGKSGKRAGGVVVFGQG